MPRYEIWGNGDVFRLLRDFSGPETLAALDAGLQQLQCFDADDDDVATQYIKDFVAEHITTQPSRNDSADPPNQDTIDPLLQSFADMVYAAATSTKPQAPPLDQMRELFNGLRRNLGEPPLTDDQLRAAGLRWKPCDCGRPFCNGGAFTVDPRHDGTEQETGQ